MPPLHRHQLVRLTDAGWRAVCERPWDDETKACLAHWAAQRLPLVVTRQPAADALGAAGRNGTLALGLAAPLRWQRRRIALCVEQRDIAWFEEFPLAQALAPLLSSRARPAWQGLCAALASFGATARVYGSHGWQMMSGLPYLHPCSDVDLWTAVADPGQADAVADLFGACETALARRLDGELLFADGRGFSWREWQAWRSGRARAILCKTLHGASLLGCGEALLPAPPTVAASVLA